MPPLGSRGTPALRVHMEEKGETNEEKLMDRRVNGNKASDRYAAKARKGRKYGTESVMLKTLGGKGESKTGAQLKRTKNTDSCLGKGVLGEKVDHKFRMAGTITVCRLGFAGGGVARLSEEKTRTRTTKAEKTPRPSKRGPTRANNPKKIDLNPGREGVKIGDLWEPN